MLYITRVPRSSINVFMQYFIKYRILNYNVLLIITLAHELMTDLPE